MSFLCISNIPYLHTMRLFSIVIVFLLSCSSSSNQTAQQQQQNPADQFLQDRTHGVLSDSAMVVCAHPEAAEVGMNILKAGGNAIDAAIAVQFALAVVYPNAGNLGGGGFMLLRLKSGEVNALDFREKAPSASSKDMFINKPTGEVDREIIETSHLASGVPGSVDGMWTAHQKYGSMPWEKLVQPAIELAQKGFPLTQMQAEDLNDLQNELKKLNKGKNYFIKTKWLGADSLIQMDLANTLINIRDKGREGFYSGEVAEKIEMEMKTHNGIISLNDLKNYHSVWRTPVSGTYKNYKVISMPPPSAGGIALIQLLNMMENYPLKRWGFQSLNAIHMMTEAEKRVYADRATWLGDPDFTNVPAQQLTSKKYTSQRMYNVDTINIIPSKDIAAGNFPDYESEETTHFSIVDQYGNAVAITTTLNDSYGSRIVVAGCGFILNNEMDDFSAKPGEPNLYGLIGGEANAIVPNKRMLSNMTPTIILKDNNLFMVIGTPGGSTIITSVFQNILNVFEFDMTMQESINAPRFHHQWVPDEIKLENNFDKTTADALTKQGYKIVFRAPMGRVDAILLYDNKMMEGGADPRGDDVAEGW
jgi:gamma-glutamyltranspeptidase/glutathione hydrolase